MRLQCKLCTHSMARPTLFCAPSEGFSRHVCRLGRGSPLPPPPHGMRAPAASTPYELQETAPRVNLWAAGDYRRLQETAPCVDLQGVLRPVCARRLCPRRACTCSLTCSMRKKSGGTLAGSMNASSRSGEPFTYTTAQPSGCSATHVQRSRSDEKSKRLRTRTCSAAALMRSQSACAHASAAQPL